MRDKDLYQQILGIQAPWTVTAVELSMAAGTVMVHVEHDTGVPLTCPHCEAACPGYDHRSRTWWHLDTCQFTTLIVGKVPRMTCPIHGVVTVPVPWAQSKRWRAPSRNICGAF